MSTPDSDRERALEVADDALNSPMPDTLRAYLRERVADLIQRECAAAREQAAREMREALFDIVSTCLDADANEELGEVDMYKVEAARRALGDCPACNGWGCKDRQDHADELLAPDNVCPECGGRGYLRTLPLPTASAEQPEPREGDTVLVPVTVVDVTAFNGDSVLVDVPWETFRPVIRKDWIRANGRLLRRKGGGA